MARGSHSTVKSSHRFRWWVVGSLAVVVVLVLVGGPFIYIHLIEGPPPATLTLPKNQVESTTSTTAAGTSTPSSIDGSWNVGVGSVVGYRVQEVLVGQQSTAVGRTTNVSGSITISGNSVTQGSITVDMTSVKSDQSERDSQFDGRIMNVAAYPTSKLEVTNPIPLGTSPANGQVEHYTTTADLTIHGVTKPVTFSVSAEQTGATINVLSDIPVVFADWNISNPSIGGFVTTQSTGTLEVLLSLTQGAGNAPVTTTSGAGSNTSGGGGPVTVPKNTVPPLTVPSS
jgi:polyisoprenoid-binding protein YceI